MLQETSVESLWGIGRALSRSMQQKNIRTAYQLRELPESAVAASFAEPVVELWHELHGRPMFAVTSDDSLPRSLQSTKSFTPASTDKAFVIAELIQNIDIVFARMRRLDLTTSTISFFLKTTQYRYHTQALTILHHTNNPLDVSVRISDCVEKMFQEGVRYKATGVSVGDLRPKSRIDHDLFGVQAYATETGKVMRTVDQIRKRYGHFSIGLAVSMPSTADRLRKTQARNAKEDFMHGLPLPYLGEVR